MSAEVAPVSLAAEDAVELAEMLEFLGEWIDSDHDRLSTIFDRFAAGLYDIDELRGDLARFVFLLGGNAEPFVFGGDEQ